LLIIVIILNACRSRERELEILASKGKSLAATYCQTCHLLPDPSMATKTIWVDHILPNMGPRLGIFQYKGKAYPSSKNSTQIPKGFYPDSALISPEDWQAILYYYGTFAPDSLAPQKRNMPISEKNSLFASNLPPNQRPNPVATMVSIDPGSKQLFWDDGLLGKLFIYDLHLKLKDSIRTGSMIVDMKKEGDKILLCDIGIINPNDGRHGRIWLWEGKRKNNKGDSLTLVADSLRRPVQMVSADLNQDGMQDLVVCEFGNLLGELAWLENMGDHKYIKHALREVPGAIHAIVEDFNHDGLPDIWVLFAQGNEGIVLFVNKGHGQFEAHDILRFPAIFGSTSFELADFNGDGYADILYSAGDNADFSQILKPYHGVYIFLNDGQQHFKLKYFYPIHGCFKAMARDFDGDGDLDIAAISYFADYQYQPEEGFVYLENKGGLSFEASSLPEAKSGRWLTMDAGDLDGDGMTDIVIGNFSVGPIPIHPLQDWKKGPGFLLLKNVGRHKGLSSK
jgi:hypothetical protein